MLIFKQILSSFTKKISFMNRNMIHRIYFTLIAIFLCCFGASAQELSEKLDKLLEDKLFETTDVSLAVYDIDADRQLYAHRAHKLCRPASVLKLITTTVALNRLGCDYTINTRLSSKGSDYYLQGGIDPLFDEEDLMNMVSAVSYGSRIDTLFVDCTFMDSVYWGPGWSWDDTPWEFQPYISPLMLCGGCVTVEASPATDGGAPSVVCHPASSFYTIVNEATSNSGSGVKFTILRDWLNNSNVIRLRGDCLAFKREKMNIYLSTDFFIAVMLERLAARDVSVNVVSYASTPVDAQLHYEVRRPITDVIAEALLESNNLCAEALSYHLGALFGKRPVAQDMGPTLMEGFLDYKLSMPASYNIADGSGLSLYSYISADILLQTLLFAYGDSQIRDVIMGSLPQAGVSGTMKNRMKNSVAHKKIYAKTGTVKGVCTLAGYAKAANGHTLAFVILNSGSLDSRAVRHWQDKVCEALCR